MLRAAHLGLLILAVLAIAVADVFLKRAATGKNLAEALTSPWMLGAVLLYLYQIIFLAYFFVTGWELSVVGTLQAAAYAIIVVAAGFFYFRETLSPVQILGLVMASAGSFLLSLE